MVEIAELIKQIEAYCSRHGIKETTFGFKAVNDGKLVGRLRSGSSITLHTFQQVQACLKRKPSRLKNPAPAKSEVAA